jgi:hypothetical protein
MREWRAGDVENKVGGGSGGGSGLAPGKQALTDRLPVQRKAGAEGAAPDAKASPEIAALVARVAGSAAALRAELQANPGLAKPVEAACQTGDDHGLGDLLARAFPTGTRAAAAAPAPDAPAPVETEKAPTDATLALPAKRADTKDLAKGRMIWDLHAVDHSNARIDVDFVPNAEKVDAKNISFVQTVLNTLAGSPLYPGASKSDTVGKKAGYSPFEEATEKRRVDHAVSVENDPFYGAEWDNTAKQWKNESGGTVVGSSNQALALSAKAQGAALGGVPGAAVAAVGKVAATGIAKMNDNPGTGLGREGKGDTVKEFETVPTVLETREPLGAIKWGYKIEDKANAPIVLTGGMAADVTDAPSATWGAALDKFYEAKFETLDSFDQDKADLTAAHKATLDGIVTKMKANMALTAELGGAADLKDADPATISQTRADNAKNYLVTKGIATGRLTTQAYGADWAKAATTKGAAEPKNRRVQIWVK